MADGGGVKEEVKPKPDVAEEGKVERQPAVAEGKEVGRQPAIAEVKQVTPQPAVAEDKKVKRQPAVAKPSATQPRSPTRVWDWIICGFIISALVHRVYVHVYVPAMTMVQVPKQVTCPVHQSDPMEGGLLPTRFQTGFGKAAWHIPRHWKTWMSTPIFQKQGWLNAPLAESRQMDKIQRELKTKLPKLMGEEDNAPLLAALQKLGEETTSMAACLGGDVDTINREQRVSRVSSMSLDCKLRIFWQWSTMQNLALVLASTENIVAANIQKLDNIRSLRASVAEARDLIVRLQQDSAAKVANTDQQIIESTVTWLNTTDSAEQNPIYRTHRVAQRQYMHLTWLDLVYASLDGLLHAKEQQITYIAHVLQNYDLVETLASVKHGISTSPFHNARHGVLDTLPYRSTLLLSELRSNTTLVNAHALRRASCNWMQTHAPFHQQCTCGQTVGVRAWRVKFSDRKQVQEWTKQHLRSLFWNELGVAKIWFDDSTEAGQRVDGAEVKQRTPDIRTLAFCRGKGEGRRPWNP